VPAHLEKAVHPEKRARQEAQELLETNLEQQNREMARDTLKEAEAVRSLNQEQVPKEPTQNNRVLINLLPESQRAKAGLAMIANHAAERADHLLKQVVLIDLIPESQRAKAGLAMIVNHAAEQADHLLKQVVLIKLMPEKL
jgi:hypothetical protein